MAAAERAVVLLSGGLDSAVALGLWLDGGGAVDLCLTADYGQRSAPREATAAAALAARFGVPWRRVELPFLGAAARRAGSALVAGGGSLPVGTVAAPGDEGSARAVWVPARNAVLVAVAAAEAEALGSGVVVLGLNSEEAATFPDNTAAFVDACSRMLALGTRTGVRVDSPTLALDKPGLGRAAVGLGLGPDDLWSCYAGGDAPCGTCESCCRLARAFAPPPGSGAG